MFGHALATALIAAAPTTTAAVDPTVAEITALEQQWGEAFVKHDFDFIERIVAPEYRLFVAQPDGRYSLTSRAEWLRNGRGWRYTEFVADTVDVNRVGDTAVATVQVFNKVAMKPHRSFLTDTWVRRNGKWQIIHRYSHRLPEAAWPPRAPAGN